MTSTYAIGKVLWFCKRRGFGFIKHSDGQEVFVHFSVVSVNTGEYKRIRANELVEYEYVDTELGLRATWVNRNYTEPEMFKGNPASLFA